MDDLSLEAANNKSARVVWGVYAEDGQDFLNAEGATAVGAVNVGPEYEPREGVAWYVVLELDRIGDAVRVSAAVRSTTEGDAVEKTPAAFDSWFASSSLLFGEFQVPASLRKAVDHA